MAGSLSSRELNEMYGVEEAGEENLDEGDDNDADFIGSEVDYEKKTRKYDSDDEFYSSSSE